MALVQLADVIESKVWQDLEAQDSPEKSLLVTSGIVTTSPLFNDYANSAGSTAELPFWNDLDANIETNYSDDSETDATPQKVEQGTQIARKAFLNQGWKAADLVKELSMGDEAITHIKKRVDTYFTRQFQRRIFASCNGVLADNVANNLGDMRIDVAVESTASQTAATRFSRTVFTSAIYTLGDMASQITAIGVHSAIMKQMVDADDIDFIPDAEGRLTIPTYMGIRVIVDDTCPTVAGSTSGVKYTSILFGGGVFSYGQGSPKVPVEVERAASQGLGGGAETLWVRKTWVLHPLGMSHGAVAPSGRSFTQAELGNAATWDRVYDRKNIPLAFLITN